MGRNKDLRKRIQGEIRVIEEHYRKIAAEYGKSEPDTYLIAKWERDIEKHQRILRKYQARLPGGKNVD